MRTYKLEVYINLGDQVDTDEDTWLEDAKYTCKAMDLGNDENGDYRVEFVGGSFTEVTEQVAQGCGHPRAYPDLEMVCKTEGCKNHYEGTEIPKVEA